MSQKVINVAVIGWGNFFKHIHEQTLADLVQVGKCHLRAVCVRTADTRQALVKAHHAEYGTADYREVLRDPQIDAVIIGATHNVQAQYSIDALKAGKYVYVEKPMFADKADTGVEPADYYRQLQQLGAPALTRLAVGLNKRFAPAYRQLRQIATAWQGLKSIRMSIVDDAWRWGAKYPPGFLFWLDVCHWTDLGRWFTGAEIEMISCWNPQVEDSLMTMKMTNGAVVSIFLSGNGTMDMIKDELHVTSGARRCASVFDYIELEIFGGPRREVYQYPANLQYGGDRKYVEAITAGGLATFRGIRREMYDCFLGLQTKPDPAAEAYLKRNLPNFMRPQGWRESLTAFVESAAAGTPLENSANYRDAYIAYQIVEVAKRSVAAGGAFVPMPPT